MKETREIIPAPIRDANELERPFEPQVVQTGHYPGYRGGYTSTADGFQLLDYWRAIRKRLWLVVGIAVLATTWAAIYMARKPNIYQASAIVQVDLEQTNPDLAVSNEHQRPLANPDPAYFNTQLQLLASDSLLRRVVKEHNLDTNADFQKAKNESSTSTLRSMLRAIGLASDDRKKSTDAPESALPENSSLASSDELADAVRLAPYVDVIKRDLGVEPIRESRATVKDTRLIEITFRNANPDLAAFVVNSMAETFVDMNQEKRSGTSRKTSDFLGKRIADLQSEIKDDETKRVELTKKEGILPTSGEGTIDLDRLSGLNKQLLEAENQRKNAEAQYFAVRDNPDSVQQMAREEMARYITEKENGLRDLRNETQKKIADLDATKSRMLLEYKETAPEIKEIDKQIDSLNSSLSHEMDRNTQELKDFVDRSSKTILTNLQTKYLQAKEQEDKIRSSFDQQYNVAQGQNEGAVLLKLLEQKIDTNKGFLKNMIEQQSGNDVASQGSDNNISVREIAIPPDSPVSPRRLMTVAAALFVSTLFGMGLALFLEYLDDTIRTTEAVESYLGLPALAAIPTMDSMPKRRLLLVGSDDNGDGGPANQELLINSNPRSSLAEAYRQLRTSILLSTAGHAPKSLLITSSLPSEGKTTTATNTAISLAQTGAKVLLIDADMRRPRLHSVFGLENGVGLSSLLSSEFSEAEILAAVKIEPTSKLNLLTSGPIPPNPAELIGSEQMADLLKFLQKHFTHVVVDSPPIASFTDGVLIASMVDGVILVVNAGSCSRQVVRRSRQLLTDIGARIFGVVLNNVNLRTQDNYYYYQSYYHREGYHSSEEQQQ
jgi:capsular exopolysaccharide synthesis family protein